MEDGLTHHKLDLVRKAFGFDLKASRTGKTTPSHTDLF